MQELPITSDLVPRLKQIDLDYTRSQLENLQQQPGNVHDVVIESLGQTTVLLARGLPCPIYNRVLGMGPGDVQHVAAIINLYRERQVRCRFDIVPGDLTRDVAAALVAGGLRHAGFRTILYARPRPDVPPRPASLVVDEVRNRRQFEQFTDLYLRGTECLPERLAETRRNLMNWFDRPGWHLHIARFESQAAGTGVLFISGGAGYLVSAATVSALRGRGVQTALIHRRVALAAELGCDLVAAQTMFASSSQNNLERAGFRIAYTKAIWVEPEGNWSSGQTGIRA